MIRMLGVLCGAAIATALLTWLVGVPQFTSERVAADAPLAVVTRGDAPPADTARPEPPGPGTVTAAIPTAPPVSAPAPAAEAVSSANLPAAPEAVPGATPTETTPLVDETLPDPVVPALPLNDSRLDDPQWFAFWTPFRSEIAANGFVGRLQSVTGLDYRVVKVRPGVYEVAFAYSEDAEIDSNLSTISAATGLDLPGVQ